MTHFAGVFVKRGDLRPEHFALELKHRLSRFPGEQIGEFVSSDCYLCHFDLSGDPAVGRIESPGRLAILCGTPRLSGSPYDVTRDRRELADRLACDADGLRAARGVFCGAMYDHERGELRLFTDRLGIRPIYIYEDERLIAFATALRILSACSFCPTDVDLLGVIETVRFGGGVGSRTIFEKIRTTRAAEVIRITRRGMESSFYWRWDDIAPRRDWPEEGASDLHERFLEAVVRRRRSGPAEYAFLSGGMDSRSIVSTLQAVGAKMQTYCFSPPGLLDGRLSRDYAAAAGIRYTHRPHHRVIIPEVQRLMAQEMRAQLGTNAILPPAWSGDGGSVGLGHVYLERTAIESLRAGQVDQAIERFLAYFDLGLPRGIFTARTYQRIRSALYEEIRQDLTGYNPAARDRWLYLFLSRNEQRHHLNRHFEELDRNRLELVLPFFDGEFLAYVCSLPIDACLWHGAYSKFFELLPASARAVPWQTYPGHVPCPLSLPTDVFSQWDYRRQWRTPLTHRMQSLSVLRYVFSPNFPATLLDRTSISLRALADFTWLSDQHFAMAPVVLCANSSSFGRKVVMAQ